LRVFQFHTPRQAPLYPKQGDNDPQTKRFCNKIKVKNELEVCSNLEEMLVVPDGIAVGQRSHLQRKYKNAHFNRPFTATLYKNCMK
jgi:hypothetical protein